MRVLLVCHVSELGGGEYSLLDLVHGMQERVELGQPFDSSHARDTTNVTYFAALPAPGPLASALVAAGVTVFFVAGLARITRRPSVALQLGHIARACRQLRALVGEHGIDLVHANSATAGLFASAVGCPLIWHVRDLRAGVEVDWLAHRAAAALAPSNACAAAVRRRRRRARVELIANGIDTKRFEAVDRAHVSAGEVSALAIAHFAAWKGHDRLLQALSIVRQRGLPLRLTVVGGAPFADNARQLADWRSRACALGVGELVEFVGIVDDVAGWLARADVLIHSAYPEPFGRVVVEAMAAGLPVVAFSGEHGPGEILADGSGGWLANPISAQGLADTLLRVASDVERLRACGVEARAKALALFSRGLMAQRVRALYHDLVPAPRGALA